MTEAQHQANVIKWSQQPHIRAKWPDLKLLFHIANGGSRDAIEGKHLKQQGVKPGVPDLCLPVARGQYHGVYLEMKAEKGKLSSSQVWWISALANQGYSCNVCYGWQQAVEFLEWYLSLGGDENGKENP